MKYRRTSSTIAFGILLSAIEVQSQLSAHQFIVKPFQLQVESGAKLPFRFKPNAGFLGKLR